MGNFREHKFSQITNKHASKKNFMIFIFMTRSQCLTAPPTISSMEMVTLSVLFQRRNNSKISTLNYQSVSVAVGEKLLCQRELTPRMYSQFNELLIGHKKFPQFARCFDDKIGQFSDNLLDLQLEGTVLDSSARTFWRKNFLWEQIFANWCLIVKIAKISALRKFPTIQ